jgi:predicted dehydrogenase
LEVSTVDALNRRQFLTTSAAAGAVTLAALQPGPAGAAANEVIRVGVIGLNGRGADHIEGFRKLPGAEVAALCDVDEKVLGTRADALDKATDKKVKRYADLRKLFDDKEIDAVSIATPNHWHSLAGIWAMQAGKDVYVEKPCSHNVWEGRQLVKAARKYNRMCQHGTQGRSSPSVREAMQKLREGVIGTVYMAKGLCYKWRPSIGKVSGPQPIPAGIDYDLWLGPAAKQPLRRKRLHYDWHWFWDFGNGDIGNQGVHEMDMARWGLGVGLPRRVQAAGGHYLFDDNQETPNTQIATFEFPEAGKLLQFEVRPWITNHEGGFGTGQANEVGVIFYGSEGYMTVQYFEYKTFLGRRREPGPAGKGAGNEYATFIEGVRQHKQEALGVDVEEGHLSSALCHLANMAYRLGRPIEFDPTREQCPGDAKASELLTRTYRPPFVVPAVS